MLAAAGFGVLVLTLGTIAGRMEMPRGSSRGNAELAPNQAASSPLAESAQNAASRGMDDEEEPDDNDSLEERIRKKFGMIRRSEVWLPAMPLAGAVSAAGLKTSGTAASSPTYAVPLYITTGRLPDGRAGEGYAAKIQAVGGVPPYKWAIDGGALDASLALSRETGEVSGKPQTASTTTFRVRVTDVAGAADVAEFKVRITDALIAPDAAGKITNPSTAGAITSPSPTGEIASTTADATTPSADPAGPVAESDPSSEPSPDAPLTILATPLADAKVKESFAAQFAASGGKPPYTWFNSGALPQGITLTPDGAISGVPQIAGDATLNVAVTDQSGQTATQSFALLIKSALPDAVTNLSGFISLHKVALTWINPADPAVSSIRVVRNAAHPPANETDGLAIYEGQGTSVTDSSLPFGPHYYAAFAMTADAAASEPAHLAVVLRTDADPFADAVGDRRLLSAKAYNQASLPGIVLGPPQGGGISQGSLHVVSLGAATINDGGGAPYGGSIVISFENNLAYDGPGADFTVFENVFYINNAAGQPDPNTRMMEPAVVSVSQDGVTWFTFPFDFSPRYDAKTGALNLRHPFVYNKGFAGVNPVIANGYNVDPTDISVSGGDSFDLADLHVPGLTWIRFIRIQSAGNKWLTDADGDLVYHLNDSDTKAATRGSPTSGFDLDAVTAIWLDAVR